MPDNQYIYLMKRSLLLLPFFALVLMACPQKHATTAGSAPAAPDPNGYNNGPQGSSAPQSQTQAGYDGGAVYVGVNANAESSSGSSSSSGSGSNLSTGDANGSTQVSNGNVATGNASTVLNPGNVGSADSATHVVGKPDSAAHSTRLVVSFVSEGAGIDHAAQKNFEKWLSKRTDVKYTVTHWGKEGEMDYCFLLNDKRAESQAQFVKEVRDFFGVNKKVQVNENVACSHKHLTEAGLQNVVEATDNGVKADSSNMARVVVSFISKGAGIDRKAQEKLDAWLKERGTAYETKNWGREGETNYCFFLTGMQKQQQEKFVSDLKTFIGANEMVIVEEWGKCDRRK